MQQINAPNFNILRHKVFTTKLSQFKRENIPSRKSFKKSFLVNFCTIVRNRNLNAFQFRDAL